MEGGGSKHSRYQSCVASSSVQIMYEICLRVKASHRLMWRAGTCHALLRLIAQPQRLVGFHRDRAAVALAHMASNHIIKLWLRVRGMGDRGRRG